MFKFLWFISPEIIEEIPLYLPPHDLTSKALYTKPLLWDTGISYVTPTFCGLPFQTSKVSEGGDLEFYTTNVCVGNSFEEASYWLQHSHPNKCPDGISATVAGDGNLVYLTMYNLSYVETKSKICCFTKVVHPFHPVEEDHHSSTTSTPRSRSIYIFKTQIPIFNIDQVTMPFVVFQGKDME